MTRIVHCPGCKVLLVEPTAGVPIYQCGKCFMVLRAKHAIQSSLQLQDEAVAKSSNDSSSSSSSSTAGPLYKQRSRDQHELQQQQYRAGFPSSDASSSSSSADNLYDSSSSKPLYTSRHHSASKPPLQSAQQQQQQGSMMLLQDMRKLAREAFHSGKHQETMNGNSSSSQREGEPEKKIQEHGNSRRLAEENGFGFVGVGVGVSGSSPSSRRTSGSDFDFHRHEQEVLGDMYAAPPPRNRDYEAPLSERREHEAAPEAQGDEAAHPGIREYAPSDYHSTLDEFESRSQVSDIGASSRRTDLGSRSNSGRVEGRPSFNFEQTQRQENVHGFRASVEMLPASPASEKDGPLEGPRYRRLSVSGNSTTSSSFFSEASSEQVRARTATNIHIERKKVNYPRLESPYVVCQHCRKLLEVPRDLPPSKKPVQKLRCGACQKISRFSIDRNSVNCTNGNHFVESASDSASDGYLYEHKQQEQQQQEQQQQQQRQQQQQQYLTSTASEYNLAASSPTSRFNRASAAPESRFKEEQQAAAISNNGNGFNSVNLKNNVRNNNLRLDMMISSTEGSPDRGSAPASFHHGSNIFSSNVVRGGSAFKGYESAPEFQSGDENLPSSSYSGSMHARSDSATSRFPMAPCLHELFGYESPSQFLKNVEHQQQHIQHQHHHGNHHKPAQKNSPGGNKSGGFKDMLLRSLHDFGRLHFHQQHAAGSTAAAATAASTKVTVNGQVIPDELVRRAEEQAGPIHPGSYWYDYRAGFWGVMGGPCVGIIPPRIEEFNIPMHAACSAGRTEVFVNGRELHQQDLDVLVKRGLPAAPKAAYTIDIDGAVIDLASESEIRNLGRLAPSMEKRGVGYGMYPLSAGS